MLRAERGVDPQGVGEPPELGLLRAAGLVTASGTVGIGLLRLVQPVASTTGVHPAVIDATVAPVVLNIFNLSAMAWALRRYEGRRLSLRAIGLKPLRWRKSSDRFLDKYGPLIPIVALLAITASPARTWLIDRVWNVLPGPEWSTNSTPATMNGHFPIALTGGLVAYQVLVRNPFTVGVEETYMQGYLFPRLGSHPVVKVSLLRAWYHMFQWWAVPSVVPYAFVFGILRGWAGNPYPSIALHYVVNAADWLSRLGDR